MIWGQTLTDEHRMKIGATKLKIPLAEYRAKKEAGLKWCHQCKDWRPATTDVFDARGNTVDGLAAQCKACMDRLRTIYAAREAPATIPRCGRCVMVPAKRYGPTPEPVDVLICWGCGHESAS